jgi:hypothetical protein
MDPNVNLLEQRKIIWRIFDGSHDLDDVDRLAELVGTLDEWLQAGGALPHDWERKGTK